MLKDRSFMKDIPYIDVDNCQFADWGYQKPSRLWCCRKISELPNKICDNRTCRNLITTWYGSVQHRERLGGDNIKFSTRKILDSVISCRISVESIHAFSIRRSLGGNMSHPAVNPLHQQHRRRDKKL
jgi:hypothetical protein